MGIINLIDDVNDEYKYSRELNNKLKDALAPQERPQTVSANEIKNCRLSIQKKRMVNQQNNLNLLQDKISFIEARLNDIAPE